MREWRSRRARWDSPHNAFTIALDRARAAGAQLLDLTVSNPTLTGDWHDPEVLREVLRSAASAGYEPEGAGMMSARVALAASLSTPADTVHPDDLILCASTSEAYSWIFRIATDPGDTILTHAPSYPLIDALAELESLHVDHFPLTREANRWTISRESIDSARGLDARVLCVVNPNNPTGNFVEGDARDGLLSTAAIRGMPVVSDEVFIDYPFEGAARESLASSDQGLVFALGGLSKTLALPHWKLAWIRIAGEPERKRQARAALEWVGDTYLSVSTPVQRALPRLLELKSAVQKSILHRLRANLSTIRRILAPLAGVEVMAPEGGWSVVIRIPSITSDEELAMTLLERERTVVQPGYFFDMPWDATFVVSLLTRPEVLEEGALRMRREITRLLGA